MENSNKYYIILLLTILLSILFFASAPLFHENFNIIMSIASYLTWHIILEFSGVIIAICVFCVSYFSYDQTKNFRYLFLGSLLLLVGFIDFFHTMSFKGMPEFFVPNDTANRATTFWIVGKLIISTGFLFTLIVPVKINIPKIKIFSLLITLSIGLLILILITYNPELFPPMYIEGQGLTKIKIILEYIVIILNFITICFFILEYRKNDEKLYIILSIALTLEIFSEISFTFYGSVYDIYNYVGHLYKFIMYYIIFRVMFINNIRKPYMELKSAKDEIKNYADNLDKIVERRTNEITVINKKLLEDLEYARDIQLSMLPNELPMLPDVDFKAYYKPAEHVSGDFYNIIKINDTKIGLYIGDVSGHGVPAAMLTIFMNQNIKTAYERESGDEEPLLPSEVLKHVYLAYNKTNFKTELYSVMLYGILDLSEGVFTCSSAGLNVPPLLIQNSGEISELQIKGFPICKIQNYAVNYIDTSIELKSGDKILFYTDGLIDAKNKEKQPYSKNRLQNLLCENYRMEAKNLLETITADIFIHTQDCNDQDDITCFIMEIK